MELEQGRRPVPRFLGVAIAKLLMRQRLTRTCARFYALRSRRFGLIIRQVCQRTTLTPTQGSVHSDLPSRCRNHCVPMPVLTRDDPGVDEAAVMAAATVVGTPDATTSCFVSSNIATAVSFSAVASPARVDCATSATKPLMSSANVPFPFTTPSAESAVVYSLGVNHAATAETALSVAPCWGESKKQRSLQWHEDAKRMIRRNEQ
jgi:hypothetical protein